MKHLLITLPSVISFEDYKKELDQVSDGKSCLNFKISNFPKEVILNKTKVYLTHRGNIIGWMYLTGLSEKEFNCGVTGKPYKGKFLERTGTFHYLKTPVAHKGFQGYRYIDEIE